MARDTWGGKTGGNELGISEFQEKILFLRKTGSLSHRQHSFACGAQSILYLLYHLVPLPPPKMKPELHSSKMLSNCPSSLSLLLPLAQHSILFLLLVLPICTPGYLCCLKDCVVCPLISFGHDWECHVQSWFGGNTKQNVLLHKEYQTEVSPRDGSRQARASGQVKKLLQCTQATGCISDTH